MRNLKIHKYGLIVSFLISLYSFNNIYATSYYVSSSEGKDKFSGTTIGKPFKTLARLNEVYLEPGDSVFLKRGDLFRGSLLINSSGKRAERIVFNAYGEGAEPVLSGAEEIKGWEKRSDTLVQALIQEHVLGVFINDRMIPAARYPKTGWLYFEGGGRNFMEDTFVKHHQSLYENATIRMRTKNWCYEYKKISEVKNARAYFKDSLWNNEQVSYTCDPGWGYYLENKESFIRHENDWVYNEDSGLLILKPAKNTYTEACTQNKGIIVSENSSYITIAGIRFEKYYESGIFIDRKASNIIIDDCSFRNIVL
ncbi:MAG TPA: hypothetical protein VJ951_11570 [Bacteroidales bacterium]|nr:hypothetical protein [Bacteroidales bacterium]